MMSQGVVFIPKNNLYIMKFLSRLLRSGSSVDLPSRRTFAANAFSKPTHSSRPDRMAEWLVIIPDHDGVLEKRMEVRT